MEKTNPASQEEKSKDEQLTPHELLEKHLKDPNHAVTDEELKNLKVGSTPEDTDVLKETKTKEDELRHHSPPNPYDVLG